MGLQLSAHTSNPLPPPQIRSIPRIVEAIALTPSQIGAKFDPYSTFRHSTQSLPVSNGKSVTEAELSKLKKKQRDIMGDVVEGRIVNIQVTTEERLKEVRGSEERSDSKSNIRQPMTAYQKHSARICHLLALLTTLPTLASLASFHSSLLSSQNIGSSMDGGRSMDVDDNNSSSLSPPLMPSTPNPPTPTPMSFTPGSTKTNNRTQGNDTTNITHSPPPLLTDVLETLIYIHGESMSSKTKSLCPPFAVTWHGKRNRHAVWALQDVPEPELPEDLNVNFGEGLVGEGVEGIHNLASTLGHVPFVPNSGNDGSIVDHAIFAATLTRSQPLRSTGGQMPGSHSEALASALGVEEGGGLNNTVLSSSSNLSNAGAPQGDQQMVGMQFTHPGSTHSSNQGETQNDYVNAAGTIGRREGWGEVRQREG